MGHFSTWSRPEDPRSSQAFPLRRGRIPAAVSTGDSPKLHLGAAVGVGRVAAGGRSFLVFLGIIWTWDHLRVTLELRGQTSVEADRTHILIRDSSGRRTGANIPPRTAGVRECY